MPVVEAREPITRVRWSSTDPDAVADYLRATYTDFQPTCVPPGGIRLLDRGASTRSSSIARLRHSGALHTRADPPSSLVVVQTLAGGPHYIDVGQHTMRGTLKLTPTWSAFDTVWDDVTVQTVTLDHDAVTRTAAELTGLEPEAVAFTSVAPMSDALAAPLPRANSSACSETLGGGGRPRPRPPSTSLGLARWSWWGVWHSGASMDDTKQAPAGAIRSRRR